MTKDEKFEILDLVQEVIERCEETIWIPSNSDHCEGSYQSSLNPEKVRVAIRAMKDNLDIRGEL